MNNSTVNFTTPETSTNSTTSFRIDIISMFVYSISFVFGLSTHSYVLWLIVTATNGVATEFFNLNLSVCEIGICLNCLFYNFSECFSSIKELAMFLLGLVFTGRPLFESLICVKRYLAVVHPVIFLKYKPLRYRLICGTAVWIITLCACFFCLYRGQYKQFFPLQFLLLFSVQLFCLVSVLRALKQSGPGDRRREEENHMKRRAFQIILITTVSMAIIYVPFTLTGLFTILSNQNIYILWITSLICYILSGFVQPVLYLRRTGKLSCLCASHLQP